MTSHLNFIQQFTVPQFIDVEDKIIGPITARQFVIMLAAFLLIALCYKIFAFNFFVFVGTVIFGVFGTFAFIKINSMPFHYFVLNFIQTLRRPGTRVWNNKLLNERVVEDMESGKVIENLPPPRKERINTSRLAELSLIVDTKGVYQGEKGADTKIDTAERPDKKIIKDFAI